MLTLGQHRVFQFIKSYQQNKGYSPTMAEIAQGIGINSRGVAHRYVKALVDKGLIRILPNRHRSIELAPVPSPAQTIVLKAPITGACAEPQEEVLDLNTLFVGQNRCALRMQGSGMMEEEILEGDILLYEVSHSICDGQVMVAVVAEQEIVVKRMYHNVNDNTVSCVPIRGNVAPKVYSAELVQIQGLFLGLVRIA